MNFAQRPLIIFSSSVAHIHRDLHVNVFGFVHFRNSVLFMQTFFSFYFFLNFKAYSYLKKTE